MTRQLLMTKIIMNKLYMIVPIFGLVKFELFNIFGGCFELFMMEFGIDYCLLAIELYLGSE